MGSTQGVRRQRSGKVQPGAGRRRFEPGPDRAELGRALRCRSDDVLRICQDRYFDQAEGIPWEVIAADPTWSITTVAVIAIANWLETGAVAGRRERDEIASLGHAAAKQEARASIESSPQGRPAEPAGLSVALLTKLNLWWSDATVQVLTEEAVRLGTSPATLEAATDMVTASCKSSMVRMAKRYDAELQRLHDQLAHLARHDPLTGLANRPVLLAQLDKGIDRLERRPGGLAVAFVDLDNFKTVNDVLGHHCGDELLAALADRFVSTVRPGDTISRFGGDEFVALFEDLSEPSVEGPSLAERLRHALDEPSCIAGERIYVTASVGLAVVTGARCRSEDVLTQADTAMYASKRAGRNRVTCVQVAEVSGTAPVALAGELRRAVEERQLRLDYQPLYALRGGLGVCGFEALLRWDHPVRGPIPPLRFVPVAEESGLIAEIGAWVLEEACRQASSWRQASGRDLAVAVNVSGRQLGDPSFPNRVRDVLATTSTPAGSLVLEVNENVLLREHPRCESVLRRLAATGVRLSIDDFGSGYSSLARLRQFPVGQLKVDRDLVRDMSEHADTRIVRAIVNLAHDLDLEVVAEGVETEFELASLRQLDCDLVQGFLLGEPAAPAAIEAELLAETGPGGGGRVLSVAGHAAGGPAGVGPADGRREDGGRP